MFGEVLRVAADAGEQAGPERVHPVQAQEGESRYLGDPAPLQWPAAVIEHRETQPAVVVVVAGCPDDRCDLLAPEVESLDLRREKIAAILWATGYDYDYGWLRVPVLDARGRPLQQRGVTQVPGLYFLGLHWMHTFKSGLLAGVGSDAEYVAEQIDLMTPSSRQRS